MDRLSETLLTGDIKSALNLFNLVKWLKIVIAIIISAAYFYNASWLHDVLTFSVVLILIIPLGFFGTFIQKLLEYNTQLMEERQTLNANEANEHFTKVFSEIELLKEQVSELQENP